MRRNFIFILMMFSITVHCQVTGNKTIGIDYATLASAISTLNSQGIGAGGVILNLAPGYSETAPAGGFILGSATLNTSLNSSNTLTIQKGSGSGANPVLLAFTGTSVDNDAIFKIMGADYVTIDGIDLQESAANANSIKHPMEWGYAILKLNANDGSQNINIINCKITLDKTNANSKGIFSANHDGNPLNNFSITSSSGINSNIHINNCTISNCYVPVSINGYTGNPSYYDNSLELGSANGNNLSNFGGGNTATFGITVTGQNGIKIENNVVTSGAGSTNAVTGINITNLCSGNILVNHNSLTITSGSTTNQFAAISNAAPVATRVDITNNSIQNCDFSSATTASFYGIFETGAIAGSTVNITGNTVSGCTYSNSSNTGSGNVFMICKTSGNADNVIISNNSISNNSLSGTANNLFAGIDIEAGASVTINSNSVNNNNFNGSGTSGQFYGVLTSTNSVTVSNNQVYANKINKPSHSGSLYGIYNIAALNNEIYLNNTIYGLQSASNSNITGIYTAGTSSSRQISSNSIHDCISNGGIVNGVNIDKSVNSIYKNKVYNLTSTSAMGTVNGILISGGSATVLNCIIGDLKTPDATALNAISGLTINGGSTMNIYYNTIYVNTTTTSTTTFGTSCIYIGSLTPSVILQNNIFLNKSVAGLTGGYTAAFRYISAPGTSYNNQSNANLFYAGAPSSNSLIYGEGITASASHPQSSLSSYKTYMTGRDGSSVTEDPPFLSTNGSTSDYLHMNSTTATFTEGRGIPITGITDDFDGDVRNASTPDIGADEFNGNFQSLPVRILNFSGERMAVDNILHWSTEYEFNCKGFYIERSYDGLHYIEIAFVPTISNYGTSNSVLSYNFTDHAVNAKAYYYLREVDNNLHEERSSVIVINKENKIRRLILYPNPANSNASLKLYTVNSYTTRITVTTIEGKELKKWNCKLVAGYNTVELNLYNLPTGIYIIKLTNSSGSETESKYLIKN